MPRSRQIEAVGGWAIQQLWLFWLAPIVGAVVSASIHKALLSDD